LDISRNKDAIHHKSDFVKQERKKPPKPYVIFHDVSRLEGI
jgi:hypothetical protein